MTLSTLYRHTKTGRLYALRAVATDYTPERRGERMAVYVRAEEDPDVDADVRVMTYAAFRAQFEPWHGRALLEGDEG